MTFGAWVGLVVRSALPAPVRGTLTALLSLLEDGVGETTIAAISERSGWAPRATRQHVEDLIGRGIVRRSGDLGVAWRYEVDEAALKSCAHVTQAREVSTPLPCTPAPEVTPTLAREGSTPLTSRAGVPSPTVPGSTRNRIPDARARSCPSSVLETPSLAGAREGGQHGHEDISRQKPAVQPTHTVAPVAAQTTTPAAPRLAVVPQPVDGLVIADLEALVLGCMRHGGVRGQRHGALMLAPLESQQLVGLVDRYGADAVRTVLTERCAGADRPLAMARKILAETPAKAPEDEIDVHPVYGAAPPGEVWVGGATVARQYAEAERRALERRRNPPPRDPAAEAELDRVLAMLSEGAA